MNTAIVYSSKYGCAAACAEYIKAGLEGTATLIDVDKADLQAIRLRDYDTVVLGSSIYVGAVSKKMRALCKSALDTLCQKRVGIFICCGFAEQMQEYLSKNFPAPLLEHARVVKAFGGEARMERMKGLDKLVMKAVTKGDTQSLKLSHESMESFLREISE